MNSEEAARPLLEGRPLHVEAKGEAFDILPEEVEVKALAKEGFAVAEDGPYVAALVTDLTPELVRKGWRVNSSAACRICARAPTWMSPTGSICSSRPPPACGPRSKRTGIHHDRNADLPAGICQSTGWGIRHGGCL